MRYAIGDRVRLIDGNDLMHGAAAEVTAVRFAAGDPEPIYTIADDLHRDPIEVRAGDLEPLSGCHFCRGTDDVQEACLDAGLALVVCAHCRLNPPF